MNKPFILNAQPNVPTSFHAEEMKEKERTFARNLGISSFGFDTCSGTGDECDDEDE